MTGPRARFLLAALVAWLIFAGIILGRFANNALPTYYVFRPLLGALPVAALIGLLAAWRFPSQAPLVAFVAAVGTALWLPLSRYVLPAAGLALLLLVAAAIWVARGRRVPTLPRAASTAALVFALVFSVGGLGRALLTAEAPIPPVEPQHEASGPNLYLVLLDGYPRWDTLRDDLDIDVEPFLSELEARGFDVYREAHSDRRFTDLTLMTLLTGSTEGVPPDTDFGFEGQWALRRTLGTAELPRRAQEFGYEYVVIDSPAGHVTFSAGRHIQSGGLNTLEEHLLRESFFAPFVAAWWPMLPTDSLRRHFDASLQSLVDLADPDAHRLVLAHLFQPHLPFLWDADGNPQPAPAYWPRLNLDAAQVETIGMDLRDYQDSMRGDLASLNPRLLAALDAMVARDPNAVIVLFSDHGSRYSTELRQTEWYRTFLAARTPDHPDLFASEPTPTALLRTLLDAYLPADAGQ